MAKTVAEVLRLVFFIVTAAIIIQIPIFSSVLRKSDHEGCSCNQRFFASNTSQQQQSPQQQQGRSEEIWKNETMTSALSGKLKPLGYAHYPFVLFSVYRWALETFFVIGETSVVVQKFEQGRPVYNCEWTARLPNGTLSESSIITAGEMMYVQFDDNGMSYAPAIVKCTFKQSTLSVDDNLGGVLRLHVAKGPSHFGITHSVEDVLYEQPGPPSCTSNSTDPAATVSKFAFCGPPMHGPIKPGWIEQWLTYHNYLWNGQAHFYFYNIGGISTTDDRKVLEPYVKDGLLTIIDVESKVIDEFPAWYRHQVLFINDCVHRTRCAGHSWSFFFDFDELLNISPPHTIDSLIQEHEQAPWITFANVPASTGHCAIREESRWQLERMLWHNKLPECMSAEKDPWLCTGAHGRRKFMVNPRKVFSSGVHVIAVPENGGVDLNGSVARVLHFRGALHIDLCRTPVNMSDLGSVSDLSGRYDYDENISLAVEKAREYAKSHNLLSPSSDHPTLR